MTSGADHTKPTATELAELSALADGTLDPARRAEVEGRIAASPQLTLLYERERRVVAALHQARATDRAPAALRARLAAARPSKRTAARRRIVYRGALAGACAAVALALVLVLPSGTPGAPSVSEAAALATRGQDQPAPAPDPSSHGARLRQDVDDVYFPNWTKTFKFHAVGSRSDRLGSHQALTVYYASGNEQIAYTIVSTPALAEPAASPQWVQGTEMRTLTVNGRPVVTWQRAGDTCVLSGTGVKAAELRMLAAWKVPGDH